MAVEVMDAVWEHSTAKGAAFTVLLAIANRANREKGYRAYPSIKTLANDARVDTRSVKRALSWLEDSGELRIHHGGGRHMPNGYWVRLPRARAGVPLDPDDPAERFPFDPEDAARLARKR